MAPSLFDVHLTYLVHLLAVLKSIDPKLGLQTIDVCEQRLLLRPHSLRSRVLNEHITHGHAKGKEELVQVIDKLMDTMTHK